MNSTPQASAAQGRRDIGKRPASTLTFPPPDLRVAPCESERRLPPQRLADGRRRPDARAAPARWRAPGRRSDRVQPHGGRIVRQGLPQQADLRPLRTLRRRVGASSAPGRSTRSTTCIAYPQLRTGGSGKRQLVQRGPADRPERVCRRPAAGDPTGFHSTTRSIAGNDTASGPGDARAQGRKNAQRESSNGEGRTMELGLHVCDFTWASGGTQLGPTLTRVARTAEQAGFTRLTVMDHRGRSAGWAHPSTRCWRRTPRSAISPRRPAPCSCTRWSRRSATATRACWQRSSARSTCCREGAPGWVSARRGTATRRPGWG